MSNCLAHLLRDSTRFIFKTFLNAKITGCKVIGAGRQADGKWLVGRWQLPGKVKPLETPQFGPSFPRFIALRFDCRLVGGGESPSQPASRSPSCISRSVHLDHVQTDIQLLRTISLTICKLLHNSKFTTPAWRPSAPGHSFAAWP